MEAGFKNLKVYQLAYSMALEIFQITKKFPKEEIFSLTDQIRRSSRSVCTNICEGYRKRKYPRSFSSKITDADCECSETMVWLDFARDFKYIEIRDYEYLYSKYIEIGKMLGSMALNPDKFAAK